MLRKRFWLLAMGLAILAGCGPETIILRPRLDSPAQHVSNGRRLLDRGKHEDALREFSRAKELDSRCVDAYIGIAMVSGANGDFENGFRTLDQARTLAQSAEEFNAIEQAHRKLKEMQRP